MGLPGVKINTLLVGIINSMKIMGPGSTLLDSAENIYCILEMSNWLYSKC